MKTHHIFYNQLLLALISISSFAQINTENYKKVIDAYSSRSGNAAILVSVQKGDETFTYSTGFSDIKNKVKADKDQLFEIGSASKMFTSISILKLIQEGKLSLDTKICKFYKKGNIVKLGNLKGENHFNNVTIRMLLNHTSGFIDYLNVYGDDEKVLKMLGVKGTTYSFDQIIDLAVKHGDANFVPGAEFKYCNTGYIILGDIISKISKQDWRDYVQKNIFDKANMKNTFFGTRISEKDKKREVVGHYNLKETYMPPSLASSAGEVVSNLKDLNNFLHAWEDGKFISKASFEKQKHEDFMQMYSYLPTLTYGHGVMNFNGYYGHAGQTFGCQSYVAFNPKTSEYFVIGINDAAVSSLQLFLTLTSINF